MPVKQERSELQVRHERVVLAAVRLPTSTYDARDPFGELKALAEQAGATVVGELSQRLERPVSATYIGSGKLVELKALCEAVDAGTIIFDHDLSPKQIANIEKETGRKVLDRSELILDIFASRATTREAQLQVELAQLEYTFPRLRAMWDHLERIVGGGGLTGIGTRGPGEQQLEIDRRLVQKRKLELQRELVEIQGRKRREVAARRREHFTVGIVGYTNAGKSTLFNTLTAGGAYADDRLFATLITRTREWLLPKEDASPGGIPVMLSDTVGFVRDIPHHLVASFKATLEEATHADLLLVVLDVSDPAAELHWKAVNETLSDLFDEIRQSRHEEDRFWTPPPILLLLNKADRVADNRDILVWQRKVPGSMAMSAIADVNGLPRIGAEELISAVRSHARGEFKELFLTLPQSDGKTIQQVELRSVVLGRSYEENTVTLHVRIGERQLAALKSAGAKMVAANVDGQTVAIAPLRPDVTRPGWGSR